MESAPHIPARRDEGERQRAFAALLQSGVIAALEAPSETVPALAPSIRFWQSPEERRR